MRASTKDQIFRMIKDSGDRGAENYKLANITLGYRSRITELRQDGYDIRARRIFRNGKASGTYVYYIHYDPEEAERSIAQIEANRDSGQVQSQLFERERRMF